MAPKPVLNPQSQILNARSSSADKGTVNSNGYKTVSNKKLTMAIPSTTMNAQLKILENRTLVLSSSTYLDGRTSSRSSLDGEHPLGEIGKQRLDLGDLARPTTAATGPSSLGSVAAALVGQVLPVSVARVVALHSSSLAPLSSRLYEGASGH
jgi:hypothetical protein